MYSQLKNIQILIGLLKKKGINNIVASPGGVSIPIIQSLENDGSFTCYSVVDERSAAFFALGLAQTTRSPVGVVCTSGTSVCNYLSAVTEAYYQGVPLVLITGDRNPYLYNQLETQKIYQDDIFHNVCKKAVSLPVVRTDEDFWYCERLINEALLELDHHGAGPVHINIPVGMLGIPTECNVEKLPTVKLMERVSSSSSINLWRERVKDLSEYKKILVVFGQGRPYSDEFVQDVEAFFGNYNCVLSVEHLSNIRCDGALRTYPVTETISKEAFCSELMPDLVVSLGDNFSASDLKSHLRRYRGQFDHWLIDERGSVKDVFKSLSVIFECSPAEFFSFFAENAPSDCSNDRSYYNDWVNALKQVELPEFEFSNLYVARELAKQLPENSILHLSILNSIRHMQFFDIADNIEVFANIGALGIDGSMSTFVGQAAATDKLCFLLIGDLSFFYDMNSVWIKHLGSNVRILMINNGGGGEFLFRPGIKRYPEIHNLIGARHGASAKGWVESLGFRYIAASSKENLADSFSQFLSASDAPVFFEVFTDTEQDAEISQAFYDVNKRSGGKGALKNMTRSLLGGKAVNKAVKIMKVIKED